ncbi:hypothetical protein [Halobacteriovorax sp. ZH5_bin.2]|uniref:hypothetical protein n=1 Tax=Halobacteriovorax sp. ZH5_bin.2 TaxID=3157727 RepID=UPI00370FA9B3
MKEKSLTKYFLFYYSFSLFIWFFITNIATKFAPGHFNKKIPSVSVDTLAFVKNACSASSLSEIRTYLLPEMFYYFSTKIIGCNILFTGIFSNLIFTFSMFLLILSFDKFLKFKYTYLSLFLITILPTIIMWSQYVHNELFILFGFSLLSFGLSKLSLRSNTLTENLVNILLIVLSLAIVIYTKFYSSYFLLFYFSFFCLLAIIHKEKELLIKSIVMLSLVFSFYLYIKLNDKGNDLSERITSNGTETITMEKGRKNYNIKFVFNKKNFDPITKKTLIARSYSSRWLNGNTNIDQYQYFNSYLDILMYVPKILYWSFFSFIDDNVNISKFKKMIINVEAILVSIAVFGSLVSLLVCKFKRIIILPIYPIIMVLFFSVINLGTFFRFRGPYIIPILVIGYSLILEYFITYLKKLKTVRSIPSLTRTFGE